MDSLALRLIGLSELVKKPNKLCSRITAAPGVKTQGDAVHIVPAQYFCKEGFATIVLNSEDMVRLLKNTRFCVVSSADNEQSALHMYGSSY